MVKSYPKKKPIRLKKGSPAYKNLMEAVLERDNFKCQCINPYTKKMCGKWTKAWPHHIIFRSQGGSDTMENLMTCCPWCHANIHDVWGKTPEKKQ